MMESRKNATAFVSKAYICVWYDGTWYMVQSIMYVCYWDIKGLVVEKCGAQADNMSQNRDHDGTMTPD